MILYSCPMKIARISRKLYLGGFISNTKREWMKVTYMYRKATLDDCEKVYSLICEMEQKQLQIK